MCMTCESNENGRFSSHFGLVEATQVTRKVESNISISRKDKTISRNKLHQASTFCGVYLYAKVERILFFKNLPHYVCFLWKVALKEEKKSSKEYVIFAT